MNKKYAFLLLYALLLPFCMEVIAKENTLSHEEEMEQYHFFNTLFTPPSQKHTFTSFISAYKEQIGTALLSFLGIKNVFKHKAKEACCQVKECAEGEFSRITMLPCSHVVCIKDIPENNDEHITCPVCFKQNSWRKYKSLFPSVTTPPFYSLQRTSLEKASLFKLYRKLRSNTTAYCESCRKSVHISKGFIQLECCSNLLCIDCLTEKAQNAFNITTGELTSSLDRVIKCPHCPNPDTLTTFIERISEVARARKENEGICYIALEDVKQILFDKTYDLQSFLSSSSPRCAQPLIHIYHEDGEEPRSPDDHLLKKDILGCLTRIQEESAAQEEEVECSICLTRTLTQCLQEDGVGLALFPCPSSSSETGKFYQPLCLPCAKSISRLNMNRELKCSHCRIKLSETPTHLDPEVEEELFEQFIVSPLKITLYKEVNNENQINRNTVSQYLKNSINHEEKCKICNEKTVQECLLTQGLTIISHSNEHYESYCTPCIDQWKSLRHIQHPTDNLQCPHCSHFLENTPLQLNTDCLQEITNNLGIELSPRLFDRPQYSSLLHQLYTSPQNLIEKHYSIRENTPTLLFESRILNYVEKATWFICCLYLVKKLFPSFSYPHMSYALRQLETLFVSWNEMQWRIPSIWRPLLNHVRLAWNKFEEHIRKNEAVCDDSQKIIRTYKEHSITLLVTAINYPDLYTLLHKKGSPILFKLKHFSYQSILTIGLGLVFNLYGLKAGLMTLPLWIALTEDSLKKLVNFQLSENTLSHREKLRLLNQQKDVINAIQEIHLRKSLQSLYLTLLPESETSLLLKSSEVDSFSDSDKKKNETRNTNMKLEILTDIILKVLFSY